VLPLISRQWARVLSGPSQAWHTVPMGGNYDDRCRCRQPSTSHDVEQLRNEAAALAWFRNRPG